MGARRVPAGSGRAPAGAWYRCAFGSAREVQACLEVAVASGHLDPPLPATADLLDKAIATCWKLAR